jgi:hypothetical protein
VWGGMRGEEFFGCFLERLRTALCLGKGVEEFVLLEEYCGRRPVLDVVVLEF